MEEKRVVLLHTNGPTAGLHQIVGATSEVGQLAAFEEGITITINPRKANASLIRSFERYVLYREQPLQADGLPFPVRVR